jgi:hypothetical protein
MGRHDDRGDLLQVFGQRPPRIRHPLRYYGGRVSIRGEVMDFRTDHEETARRKAGRATAMSALTGKMATLFIHSSHRVVRYAHDALLDKSQHAKLQDFLCHT